MESSVIEQIEQKLETAVLFDEKTGALHPADERANNLDSIRLHLIELGNLEEKFDNLGARVVFIATFARVVETYLKITEKHEELLADGK
jgi:hypothetical protein